MTRCEEIVGQIAGELARGRHGPAYQRFMTVRQLSARYRVSLVTAQKVLSQLKERGLLIGDSTNPALIAPAAEASSPREDTRRLGMIITNIANPFFSRLCRHVQQAAADNGCHVLMAGSHYEAERERKAIESFLEIGVDGLLVVPGLDDSCAELYRQLLGRGVQLVFISRQVEQVPADFVVADSFAGGAAVAGHLLSAGYETFGYIGFGSRLKRDLRLRGFRSALREEGVTLESSNIVGGEGGTVEHGWTAMARLMRGKDRPRAVFAFHDLLAVGALQYCREQGIRVPEEVAVAGFDNLPESEVTFPPLTTVGYPMESMARLAVQCLITHPGGTASERATHRIFLEPHLVVRRSTDLSAAEREPAVAGHEAYDIP